jgi:hypothetical protein
VIDRRLQKNSAGSLWTFRRKFHFQVTSLQVDLEWLQVLGHATGSAITTIQPPSGALRGFQGCRIESFESLKWYIWNLRNNEESPEIGFNAIYNSSNNSGSSEQAWMCRNFKLNPNTGRKSFSRFGGTCSCRAANPLFFHGTRESGSRTFRSYTGNLIVPTWMNVPMCRSGWWRVFHKSRVHYDVPVLTGMRCSHNITVVSCGTYGHRLRNIQDPVCSPTSSLYSPS